MGIHTILSPYGIHNLSVYSYTQNVDLGNYTTAGTATTAISTGVLAATCTTSDIRNESSMLRLCSEQDQRDYEYHLTSCDIQQCFLHSGLLTTVSLMLISTIVGF